MGVAGLQRVNGCGCTAGACVGVAGLQGVSGCGGTAWGEWV